jgi:hypothetical protein
MQVVLMLTEEEQMKVLQDKILASPNADETSVLLDQLEDFGHKSSPRIFEISRLSHNSDIVRTTNSCIVRIKQQFEWSDS